MPCLALDISYKAFEELSRNLSNYVDNRHIGIFAFQIPSFLGCLSPPSNLKQW